jgi:hypothetical protein
LLDWIAGGVEFEIVTRPGWMLPAAVKYVSAVALLGVLGYGIVTGRRKKGRHN